MAQVRRWPQAAAAAAAAGKTPIQHAAGVALQGPPQEVPFREIDSLLGLGNPQQQDFGQGLATELAKALQDVTRRRKAAAAMADCYDLEAPGPGQGKPLDGKRVFKELDAMVGRYHPSPETTVSERLGTFERDVQGLLTKVSSDSDLLANRFAAELQSCVSERGPDLGVASRSPAPPGAAAGAAAEAADREAAEEEAADPFSFEELDALLSSAPAEHQLHGAVLATRLQTFLDGAQKSHQGASAFADRALRGADEDDAEDEADRQHAAWRRETLKTLQPGRGGRPRAAALGAAALGAAALGGCDPSLGAAALGALGLGVGGRGHRAINSSFGGLGPTTMTRTLPSGVGGASRASCASRRSSTGTGRRPKGGASGAGPAPRWGAAGARAPLARPADP